MGSACETMPIINPTGDLIYAPIEGTFAAATGFAERIMLDQSNATPEKALVRARRVLKNGMENEQSPPRFWQSP